MFAIFSRPRCVNKMIEKVYLHFQKVPLMMCKEVAGSCGQMVEYLCSRVLRQERRLDCLSLPPEKKYQQLEEEK